MIGTIMLIIAAIMAPVWMNFSYVDKENSRTSETIKDLREKQVENIKAITKLEIKIEQMEKVHEKNHGADRRGKTSD